MNGDPWAAFNPQPAPSSASSAPGQRLVIQQQMTPQEQAQTARTQQEIQTQPLQNRNTEVNIQQGQASIQNEHFNQVQGLRQEFNSLPEVKNYSVALQSLGTALKAPDTPQGDLAIIYAYAKAADPGSVVREGEMDMATATASLPQQFQADAQKLTQGKRLPPQVRTGLIEAMRQSVAGMRQTYDLQRQRYGALAQQNGMDPRAILGTPLYDAYRQDEENYIRAHGGTPMNNGVPVDGSPPPQQGDIGFNRPHAAEPMSPQQQAAFDAWVKANPNGTPDQLVAFAKQIGLPGVANAQQYLDAARHGTATGAASAVYQKPDITDVRGGNNTAAQDSINAVARGVGDTLSMGALDKAVALGDTVFKGGTYQDNLNRQYAISDYDAQNHPWMRLGGEALGGGVLPMGDVTDLTNLSLKGAAYGGAYGLGSSRNLSDVPANVLGGAAVGAAVPQVLGRAPGAISRALKRTPGGVDPLVDPVTGELNTPMDSMTPAQRVAVMKGYGMQTITPGMAGGRSARILEQGFNNLPGSAGMMEDVNAAASGELRRSMQGVAQQFGQSKTLNEGGAAAQSGANQWMDRAEQTASKLYDAIPIAPKAPAKLDNTRAALSSMLDIFQSNPKMKALFQNSRLKTYLDALTPELKKVETKNIPGGVSYVGPPGGTTEEGGSLSWNDLKHFRSIVGEDIGEQRLTGDSPYKSQLRSLYGALSEDMRNSAAAQGPRALRAWERANTFYQQKESMIEDSLTRILGPVAKGSPEKAAAAIQAMTKGGKASGDLRTLAQIKSATVKSGAWDEIASTLIHLGGQPANSEGRAFQPQTFVQWYADMSEPARAMLFKPELRKSLDGFVAMTQQLGRIKALNNTSNTGPLMFGGGTLLTAAASLLNPILGLKLGGTMAGNYALGKLWTNPKFVNLITGYGRAALTGQPNAVNSQVGRLAKFAATNPEFSEPVQAILREISNDNFVGPIAASPNPDQKQQQK